MGDIESIVSILLEVKDRGIANLNKAQAAVRTLVGSEVAAAKQSREYTRALEAQLALHKLMIPTIRDENRAFVETNKSQRQITAITQAQAAAQQRLQVAIARTATVGGRYTDALAILKTQLGSVNAESLEALQLQQQITIVTGKLTAEAAKAAKAIGGQALAEAALARVSGKTAKEVEVLRAAMGGGVLTTKQAEQATIALAKAERRLAEETRKAAAERLKKLVGKVRTSDRDIERQVLAQAAFARASRDARREIEILNTALQSGLLTLRAREKVMLTLARAQSRLTRETLAGAASERRAAERKNRELERQQGLLSRLGAGYSSFTRTLASFVLIGFTLRTFGRTIERFVVEPVRQMAQSVLEATDNFRRLEASLTGVVGAGGGVRSLVGDIREASQGLPLTTRQGLTGIRGLAFTPATASILSNRGAERVDGLNNLLTILSGLASIDPEQGIEGAQFAVREALAGEFRSLRFRFELSPDAIAGSIGATLEELKADPQLTIKALRTFVDTFVGEEGIDAFNNLLSVQGVRFRGVLEEFFAFIGDQGIYDRVVRIVRRAGDLVSGLITTPGGQAGAATINRALDTTLDRVLQSASVALTTLSGVSIDLTDDLQNVEIDALATSVGNAIEGLGKLTASLLEAVPVVAAFASSIARSLGVDVSATPTPETAMRRLLDRQARLEALLTQLDDQSDVITGTVAAAQTAAASALRELLGVFNPFPAVASAAAITADAIEVAPLGLAASSQAMVVRDQELLTGDDTTLLTTLSTSPFVRRQEIAQELRYVNSELQRLRLQRANQSAAALPTTPTDSSTIKALLLFGQQLGRTLEQLPKFNDVDTLVGNVEAIAGALREQSATLDRNLAESGEVRGRLNPRLEGARLEGAFDQIAELEEKIARLLAAEADAREGFVDGFRGALGGFLQASEGFTRQLPDIARIRQSTDILSVIAGQDFTSINGIAGVLGSERARELGADQRSVVGNSLAGVLTQTGADPFLDPRLGDTIVNTINNIADAVARYNENAKDGVAVTEELVDLFIARLRAERDRVENPQGFASRATASVTTRDEIAVENFNIAIEKLEELKAKANEVADTVEIAFQQLAAGISTGIGDSLVAGLTDAFETGGANILEITGNLLRSIQQQVLRMILEFTIIRGLVNPALNSTFGLTGANLLPTIGAKGMVVSQGQVRPMAKGFMATGPTTFGMRGNQVGLIGEDAPEAVMPVVQAPDGSLGIRASGGGGRSTNIYMNVRANDAGSFRRSSRQMRGRLMELAGG